MLRTMKSWSCGMIALAITVSSSSLAMAQTGVDDDRVSLPEGPGSLEGVGENVEIDPNMGSMRYSVDIKTPAGRQGFSPNLGLSYSSSSPVGVLGVGWSMEMPTVERMTSRRTPLYQTDDLFAFDGGAELVLVDDSGPDFVYRDRFEKEFKRYTWVKAGSALNDDYWVVEYPDGSKGYFGADSQGARLDSARALNQNDQAFRYHLTERVDPYGNRVKYTYDNFTHNKPLITQVEWAFTDGTPLYKAVIDYEIRPDLISDAGGGFEELIAYRVVGIGVLVADELTREYELEYQAAATSGGVSRLGRVTEYGLGGKAGGVKNPIEFSFDYQRALGVDCEGADCDSPYMVNMGMLPGGVSFDSGLATLVDINGDALPDIVDTSQAGAHRFFLNQLTPDGSGGFTHAFMAGFDSAVGDGGSFRLDGDKTQTLDVNGDGYSDLVNLATGRFLIKDPEGNDWAATNGLLDVTSVNALSPETRRFIDYNGDKRIDVLVASSTETRIYENTGGSFDSRLLDFLGSGFESNLQLSDINGDGVTDPVEIRSDGSVRYKLNLGWGNFSPEWRNLSGAALTQTEQAEAQLEDLNGDGRDDIVVVSGSQVKYWLNRGDRFDPATTITSGQIPSLPTRELGTQVFFADMNANGSEDVVWLTSGQPVQYLELFPQRPNLMSDVSNGIGSRQVIRYSTAAEQQALARGTDREWESALNIPMAVVNSADMYVTLTGAEDGSGLHDVVEYVYQNGFYDGIEKQYRGFARVEARRQGGEFQESETTISEFDLGEDDRLYYNGLLLTSQTVTNDAPVQRKENTYEECPVAEVPSASALEALGRFPVKHICETEMLMISQERQEESAWKTTRVTKEYDGYGQVIKEVNEGIIDQNEDELTTETSFADPRTIWRLGLAVTTEVYDEASGDRKLTTNYYDGPDFQGLAMGEVTHGFLSRSEVKVDNSGKVLQSQRQKRDEFGNSIETIMPNGSVDEPNVHRRRYTYDENNLFLSATEILLEDATGPYALRRESRFDIRWQKPSLVSDWVVFRDGQALTSDNATTVVYDRLGRTAQNIKQGDDDATPTEEFSYDLGDPFSSVSMRQRATANGAIDEQSTVCFDGKGRQYQMRTRIANDNWLVTGFTTYNARGAEVEKYEPYRSDSGECDITPPTSVASTKTKFDGLFRPLERTLADESIYGTASTERYLYLPFEEHFFDAEDTLAGSPHEDTPLVRITDGLGRLIMMQRTLNEGGAVVIADYQMHYDNTGSFSGYTDPEGTRHELVVDLADRVTEVGNPNVGILKFEYSDSGKELKRIAPTGVVTISEYDGADRLVARWDEADKEGTLVTWSYDVAGDCPVTECTQLANRLAQVTFPLRDADGNVSSGSNRFGYDIRGRRVFAARSYGDLSLPMGMTYDNQDRVVKTTSPDGFETSRAYDGVGRVSSMTEFLEQVSYTDNGLLAGLDFTNGASSDLSYDAILRPTSLTNKDGGGNVLEQFAYTRDRLGSIIDVKDESGRTDIPGAEMKYTYDAWYRLVQADMAAGAVGAETLNYAYSLNDNNTSIVSSLDSASPAHVGDMSYDAARPNALAEAGGVSYDYNEFGQMVARGGSQMTWDYLDRMTSYSSNSKTSHYMYAEDVAIAAEMTDDSMTLYSSENFEVRDGVATTYARYEKQRVGKHESITLMPSIYPDVAPLSDASTSAPDGEINAADAWAIEQGVSGQVPFDAAATTERVLGAAAARMLVEEERSAKHFFLVDHLGSMTIATNEGGEVSGQRGFYPTGVVRWEQGYVDPYGFTGQEHMSSGMVRFKFRFLDPRVGRWASFDPMFFIVDIEKMSKVGEATTGYAYVANNFTNAVDPLGLEKNVRSGSGKNLTRTDSGKLKTQGPSKRDVTAEYNDSPKKITDPTGGGTERALTSTPDQIKNSLTQKDPITGGDKDATQAANIEIKENNLKAQEISVNIADHQVNKESNDIARDANSIAKNANRIAAVEALTQIGMITGLIVYNLNDGDS